MCCRMQPAISFLLNPPSISRSVLAQTFAPIMCKVHHWCTGDTSNLVSLQRAVSLSALRGRATWLWLLTVDVISQILALETSEQTAAVEGFLCFYSYYSDVCDVYAVWVIIWISEGRDVAGSVPRSLMTSNLHMQDNWKRLRKQMTSYNAHKASSIPNEYTELTQMLI